MFNWKSFYNLSLSFAFLIEKKKRVVLHCCSLWVFFFNSFLSYQFLSIALSIYPCPLSLALLCLLASNQREISLVSPLPNFILHVYSHIQSHTSFIGCDFFKKQGCAIMYHSTTTFNSIVYLNNQDI
jgi:hypothetical protein